MLPTKFRVNWLFSSEEEGKIDFQGGHHLGLRIGMILAIFDLQITLMLPSKFGVNWPFGSGEEAKNRFSRWGHGSHLGFLIGMVLAIFDQHVTPMLPTKFRVNWHLGLGEAKNRFSRWPPWRHSWIDTQQDFSYFWSTSHPNASYQVSTGLSVQEKKRKIDFQDGGHLGFPIGTILAILIYKSPDASY